MLTEEDRQEILSMFEGMVQKAAEKAMLMLPDVIGNLMANYVAATKMREKFYTTYPEFSAYKQIVGATIEDVQADDPTADFDTVLKTAVPLIRKRVELASKLDTSKVNPNPNLDFSNNGAI